MIGSSTRIDDGATDGTDAAPRAPNLQAGPSRANAVGTGVAALVATVPGVWGLIEPSWGILVAMSAVGFPIAMVLGWRFGLAARRGGLGEAAGIALRMAVYAVVLGALAVGTIGGAGSLAGEWGPLGAIGVFALLVVAGLIVVGVPALGITFAAAVVWVVIMRLLPDRLVGDHLAPLPSVGRRVVAAVVVVAIVGAGGVPFAQAALDGHRCPDIGGRAEQLAWAPGGERLVIVVETGEYLDGGMDLVELDVVMGTVRSIRHAPLWIGSPLVDPTGTTWWMEIRDGSPVLWSAPIGGAALPAGRVDAFEVAALWWLDGGLAAPVYETEWSPSQLIRLEPRPDGTVATTSLIRPWDEDEDGFWPALASSDGRRIGWMESRTSDVGDRTSVDFVMAEGEDVRRIDLPDDTYEATLAADGTEILLLGPSGWSAQPIDGGVPLALAGSDWVDLELSGDHLALVRTGFQAGRLCIQDVAR